VSYCKILVAYIIAGIVHIRASYSIMFKGKLSKDKAKDAKNKDKHSGSNGPSPSTSQSTQHTDPPVSKPKLVFHCQQAHGSPTGVISEFTNVKELYKKIAECYDISPDQVNQ